MPESTRRQPRRDQRLGPGELAERLAEDFLADFWATQPRGETTVRVGDEDRVLVYRSTPEVQRQLYRLDGLRLLAPGTMEAVVRFLVEAVESSGAPLAEADLWALSAGDPLAMVRAIDQDLTRRMVAYARERGIRLGEGRAGGHADG